MPDNIETVISLIDESLNKSDTAKYDLSVQISLNEFTYCILDKPRNKYIALESFKLKEVYNPYRLSEMIEELLFLNKWLTGNFLSRKIIYITPKSTLVPVPLFEEDESESYFNFNHSLEESENLYCDRLSNLNAYNLFAVPSVVKEKLREMFYQHKLQHHLTSLIESLLIINKNKANEKITYLNIRSSSFDMIVIDGNELIYNNTFQYSSPEDFIYFVLFALQQLELNPETIDLTLLGEIEKNSALYEILFKYIRNISFVKWNEAFQYSYLFDKLPTHNYFNLLNLNLID